MLDEDRTQALVHAEGLAGPQHRHGMGDTVHNLVARANLTAGKGDIENASRVVHRRRVLALSYIEPLVRQDPVDQLIRRVSWLHQLRGAASVDGDGAGVPGQRER